VADTGTGMKEETLGRIFEPFFTTKEQGHGTGLGLATVYGIVQQHHGWISVDSQLGEGTAFHVYFPQVPVPISTGQEAAPAAPGGGGETVLVVEDEPGVRRVLEKALQRIGYRVLTAPDADAALPIWAEQHDQIRLLFTDMVMPGSLNGLQLARRLRTDNPQLPVLIASGYSSVMVESGLSPEERIHFVSKPFEVTKLAETIREALAKRTTGPG
jgi:CheY-like chemotaxis protein